MRLILNLLALSGATSLAVGLTHRPTASRTSPTASRSTAARMDFFGDLKKGLTKLQAGQYDAVAVKAKLDRQIKQKPCVMYSLSSCPFCAKAKAQLSGMGTMYSVIELDEEEDGMALKAELAGITGQTSCPQVFAGGQFVGGCNDGGLGGVMPLAKSGELQKILIKYGALSATQRI